jgi:hypothetical protein
MLSSNTTITTTTNNNKTIDIKLVNRYSSNKTVCYEMLGNQVRCAVTSFGYYDKKNSYPAVLTLLLWTSDRGQGNTHFPILDLTLFNLFRNVWLFHQYVYLYLLCYV